VVQPAAIGTAAPTGQLSASMIAYRNLANTCRSPATRQVYTGALNYFMTYLQLQKGDYDKLVQRDPKTIQMDICDFVSYMRGSGRSYAVVSVYVAALSKFFAMNDITTINCSKFTAIWVNMKRLQKIDLILIQKFRPFSTMQP
jgi:hypothetical protein